MVAMFCMRMDKCHHRPRNAAAPSVINIANRPTASGKRAAARLANVANSSTRTTREYPAFRDAYIIRTDFAQVEIERRFARQFKLQPGETAAHPIAKRLCALPQPWNAGVDFGAAPRQSDDNKRSAAPTQKNSIAPIEVTKSPRDARVLLAAP